MELMCRNFKTEGGIVYEIDFLNRTICGGAYCPKPRRFCAVEAELGAPAFVFLEDGQFFRTAPVEQFNVNDNEKIKVIELQTRNSTYMLDYTHKTVSGGILNHPLPFTKAEYSINNKAKISLSDGREIHTSSIIGIRDVTEMNKSKDSSRDYEFR